MPDIFPWNEVFALTPSAEDMVVHHLFCSYGAGVNVKTGQPVCAAYVASQSWIATFYR
jgi:hypothetical protein